VVWVAGVATARNAMSVSNALPAGIGRRVFHSIAN
jgi:hypothetical protein